MDDSENVLLKGYDDDDDLMVTNGYKSIVRGNIVGIERGGI